MSSLNTQALSACAVALMLGAAALAQSFNVDLDTTGGSAGTGVPASSYAGGAGQPGVWNSIKAANPTTSTLVGLNGATTAVTFTRATNGQFVNLNNANATSGNFEKLVDDIYTTGDSFQPMAFTFNNLQAGHYVLYTYAFNAEFPQQMTFVTVNGSFGQVQQECGGGPLDGNRAIPGKVYAAHGFAVQQGGSVTVTIQSNNFWPVNVAGFQLKRLPEGELNRIYVNNTVNGDGGSWTDGIKNLQDALEAARRIGGTLCQIWVRKGFYFPTTGNDRNASFVIPNGLELYGGFFGNETSLAERTFPAFNITNLSGSIGTSSTADNSYHVVRMNNVGGATVIDGFTISQGTANGNGNDANGGGVLLINASPTFRNTKFISNRASIKGGAISIQGGTPWFSNCLFYNNWTDGTGGAVALGGGPSGVVRFGNCEFLANQAMGDGGAFYSSAQSAEFINCIFNANKALLSFFGNGGAIYATQAGSNVTLQNCTIVNNTAGGTSGGIAVSTNASITANNTILWANSDNSNSPVQQQQASQIAGTGFLNLNWAWIQGSNLDPQFVSLSGPDGIPGNFDDNLRLKPTSPCIDAGNNNLLPTDPLDLNANGVINELLPVDFDGKPRRVDLPSAPNTGVGSSPIVDFGAYEAQAPTCVGDLNADGKVDADDLGLLLAAFGCSGSCGSADLNASGTVDADDLGIFLAAFGQICP